MMSAELKQIGEMFRAKRKEMNLSLKEVENATSIRVGYIDAIEEGRVADFISGVYAQGFIKQYAAFLGFDFDAVLRENPEILKMPSEKHDFAYGIGTLEKRGSQGGGVKWLPNLLWSTLAATILVLAWFLARSLGVF
jgi:cytoskeletal protein RodZ